LKVRDVVDLMVLAAVWGASFLFMRIAAPEFGPVPLIATRVGIAAVFLVIVLAARGDISQLFRHAPLLVVLGIVSAAVPFSLFAYSVLSVTGGFASVLNATVPLFGALVAYLWLGDKLGPMRAAGLAIGFAGVTVVVWDKVSFRPGGSGWAVVAGLTASLLYGISASFTKRYMSKIDPLINATGSQVSAAVLLLIPAIFYWPPSTPSRLSLISALVLGVVCTGVAVILFFRLIARVGPAKAITVTYLIPAFGVLWGYLFLHEPVTVNMLTGCGVILLGTGLANGVIGSRD
jgi:drug/metabolite transporter (DMT)-like permease